MGLGLTEGLSGVNLLAGIAKGIIGKKAHDKYADKLSGLKMEMPKAISQAEGIKSDLAYGDMPGLADMMAGVDSGTATAMTGAKKVATSPAALMDALISSSTAGEAGKRELGVKNAGFKRQGQDDLARFLSTVKAPAEQRIDQFEIDKEIAIAKEGMIGTKELMSGIEGGIGSAFSAFGSGKKLEMMGARNQTMLDYWKTSSAGGGAGAGLAGGMAGLAGGAGFAGGGYAGGISNPWGNSIGAYDQPLVGGFPK